MPNYNVLEAKTNLSGLIEAVETGCETVPLDAKPIGERLGIVERLFDVTEGIDKDNPHIETFFDGRFD